MGSNESSRFGGIAGLGLLAFTYILPILAAPFGIQAVVLSSSLMIFIDFMIIPSFVVGQFMKKDYIYVGKARALLLLVFSLSVWFMPSVITFLTPDTVWFFMPSTAHSLADSEYAARVIMLCASGLLPAWLIGSSIQDRCLKHWGCDDQETAEKVSVYASIRTIGAALPTSILIIYVISNSIAAQMVAQPEADLYLKNSVFLLALLIVYITYFSIYIPERNASRLSYGLDRLIYAGVIMAVLQPMMGFIILSLMMIGQIIWSLRYPETPFLQIYEGNLGIEKERISHERAKKFRNRHTIAIKAVKIVNVVILAAVQFTFIGGMLTYELLLLLLVGVFLELAIIDRMAQRLA